MTHIDEFENGATVDAQFIRRTADQFSGDMNLRFGMVKFEDGSVREVMIDPDSELVREGLLQPGCRFRANLHFSGMRAPGSESDFSISNIRLLSDLHPAVEPLKGIARLKLLWKSNDIFVPGQAVKGRIQEHLCRADMMAEPRVALAAVTLVSRPLLGRTQFTDVRVAFVETDAGLCLPQEGSSFRARIGRSQFAGEPPYRAQGTILTLENLVVRPNATYAPKKPRRDRFEVELNYALGG
jgi:hypothetical protein